MGTMAFGEFTIKVDCDVLQADGGTRTAGITGACVALADACAWLAVRQGIPSPFGRLVAAVSVGIVAGEHRLDLAYLEDRDAEVDANLVMLDNRFVECKGREAGTFQRSDLDICSTSTPGHHRPLQAPAAGARVMMPARLLVTRARQAAGGPHLLEGTGRRCSSAGVRIWNAHEARLELGETRRERPRQAVRPPGSLPAVADDRGVGGALARGEPGCGQALVGVEGGASSRGREQRSWRGCALGPSSGATGFGHLPSPGALAHSFEGSCHGRILEAPAGTGGFGYDPLFWSDDLGKAFGEATAEEKHRVSHRGRAFAQLRDYLEKQG
jgi:inosine/xanthosine triphosphate pyrophosphatase family protein